MKSNRNFVAGKFKIKLSSRGREKAQWLGTCTVLAEDLSSISSFLIKWLTTISFRSSINLTSRVLTCTCTHPFHIHTLLRIAKSIFFFFLKDKFKMSRLDIWCDCCA